MKDMASLYEIMSCKRKKSEVWNYFTNDPDRAAFAVCSICDVKVKQGKEEYRSSWSVSSLSSKLFTFSKLLTFSK